MPQASGENLCGGRGGSLDGRRLAMAECVSASGWRGPCAAGDVTAAGANRGLWTMAGYVRAAGRGLPGGGAGPGYVPGVGGWRGGCIRSSRDSR